MYQQAIDTILGSRKLGVIKVVHVNGNTVGKRCKSRWQLARAADDSCSAIHEPKRLGVVLDQIGCFCSRTAECESQTIQNGFLAQLDDVAWNV